MNYYTHNGETLSLSDWCRKLGIPYARIASRLRRGIPFAQAISSRRLAHKDQSPSVAYNGETHTLREWAQKLHLDYHIVHVRYSNHLPPDKVFTKGRVKYKPQVPQLWKPAIFVTKDGERLTVPEWSRRIGIPANTIYQRIIRRKGDVSAVDEILCRRLPPGGKGKHKGGKVYAVNGLTLSVPQWAKHLHCTTSILYRRLADGLPLDKVFVPPSAVGRTQFFTKDGVTLPLTGWAKKLGLSIHALRARLLRSKDLDYVLSPRRPGGFVTMWRGKSRCRKPSKRLASHANKKGSRQ